MKKFDKFYLPIVSIVPNTPSAMQLAVITNPSNMTRIDTLPDFF